MTATNSSNGTPAEPPTHRPFQTISDYLSNVGNFKFIESTLREGEQFSNAFFTTGTAHTCVNLSKGRHMTDEFQSAETKIKM